MLARAASAAAARQVPLTVDDGRHAMAERPLPAFPRPGAHPVLVYENVFMRLLTTSPFANKVLRVSV